MKEPYIEETYDDDGNLIEAKMHGHTKFRKYMFSECYELKSIDCPEDDITSIGNRAFSNCGALKLKYFPEITSIGEYAFYYCKLLNWTELPKRITNIETAAFYYCESLKITELPETLSTIRQNTFAYCTNIKTMTFHKNILNIEGKAFYGCGGLKSIKFYGKPDAIDAKAFYSCGNIKEIKVPWSEGEVAGAPWTAVNATIIYNYTETEETEEQA